MGAKARTPLKALLNQLPDLIADLKKALGLSPTKAHLEYAGSLDVDNEGGVNLGAKASTPNLVEIIAGSGGVPVEVEAGIRSQHDNQGGAEWKLWVDFG